MNERGEKCFEWVIVLTSPINPRDKIKSIGRKTCLGVDKDADGPCRVVHPRPSSDATFSRQSESKIIGSCNGDLWIF